MTIDTQSAAPQGAAPVSVPAGPGARPSNGSAPAESFGVLVARLSDGAPVARPRNATAPAPAAPAVASANAAAVATQAGPAVKSAVPHNGTSVATRETPLETSSTDDTDSAPTDTTVITTAAAADLPSAVPVWLWALGDQGAPLVDDATSAPSTDTPAAAHSTDAPAPTVAAGSVDIRPTPASGAPSVSPLALGAVAPSTPVAAPDRLATATAVGPMAPDVAKRDAPSSTTTPAAMPTNDSSGTAAELESLPVAAGPVPGHTGDAGAPPAEAVAPGRAVWAQSAVEIAVDRATRPGGPHHAVTPEATTTNESSGQPDPLAGSAPNLPAEDAEAAARSDRGTVPGRFAPFTSSADDRTAFDSGNRSGPTPLTPPTTAASRPAGEPAPPTSGAVPVSVQAADPNAAAAQAAAPGRLASATVVDRIAFDRANRPAAPFSATPLATILANMAATNLASAPDNRQGPPDHGSPNRDRSDEAQALAARALDASGVAPFRLEPGTFAAARLIEVFGGGTQPTPAPASTSGAVSVGASIAIPDEGDLRHQIVQGIKFQWRDGVGDVKLTLNPKYLGELNIALRVDQSGVTAQLSADSASVRGWVMANEALLRQGLTEQGLTLSRLIVTDRAPESPPDREGRRRAPQQETPDPPAPRRSDSATFEIVL